MPPSPYMSTIAGLQKFINISTIAGLSTVHGMSTFTGIYGINNISTIIGNSTPGSLNERISTVSPYYQV